VGSNFILNGCKATTRESNTLFDEDQIRLLDEIGEAIIPATDTPGNDFLKLNPDSHWICVRCMGENGHQTHSAPVYVTVNDKPVRASAEDAQFFITWIDNIMTKTAPGGTWSRYFTQNQKTVHQRYQQARVIYSKILVESSRNEKKKQNK
jgi:hypothetical protein